MNTPLDITDIVPLACPLGYTREQVEQITAERYDEFAKWMRGQTVALCDGRQWDHDKQEDEPTSCTDSPHGLVTYPHDVAQFIRGGGPLG